MAGRQVAPYELSHDLERVTYPERHQCMYMNTMYQHMTLHCEKLVPAAFSARIW